MGLVSELRRRNVLRMAVLYLVAAWLFMQVAEVVAGLINLPDWFGPAVLGLLAIGFPIALAFSWFYELTPEGLSLEKDVASGETITHITGRRIDFIVISLLAAALLLFAWHTWWPSATTNKSIAVMAFENMSHDPAQDYFSDGLSEELLNALAEIPGLRVISRSSSFSFKDKHVDIPTVAKRLNVTHVLEGSVRKMDNRVRITAQLIDASSDSHLWSETYDRNLDDIFAVQHEIAAAISDSLKMRLVLTSGDAVPPAVIKAANTDAYDAYLRARELIHARGRENLQQAIRHLERSLRLDETFAPAHAQLAIATALLTDKPTMYGPLSVEEVRRQAVPHLDRAQELDPELAEVYGGRALLAFILDNDLELEIEHARRALALNPSYVDAMNWLQLAFNGLGRYAESDATLKHLVTVDPLNNVGRLNYIDLLAKTGRIDEAHEMADQLLSHSLRFGYQARADTSLYYEGELTEGLSWGLKFARELGFGSGLVRYAFTCVGEYDEARRVDDSGNHRVDLAEGRLDEAIRATQGNMRIDPDNESTIGEAADVLYIAGRTDEALPLYERLLDFVPDGRPISGPQPNIRTMRLALARRKVGDEDGAQAAAQIAKQDHAARRAAGRNNRDRYLTDAMIAAFDNDPDRVFVAMQSAIQHGLRNRQFFDDSFFEDIQDEPRFVALRQELDAMLAEEHDKILQLICFNNPVPEDWLPMPETCEGVLEQNNL